MGAASVGGSEAGAPVGVTQAMAPRNEVADQPAAGDVAPWQRVQWASRMGATSLSKTGTTGGDARSDEHAAQRAQTETTHQVSRPDRTATPGAPED
jgi:hypothetical protein